MSNYIIRCVDKPSKYGFKFYNVLFVDKTESLAYFVKSFSTIQKAQSFIEGIHYLEEKIQPEHFDDTFEKSYQRYLEGY